MALSGRVGNQIGVILIEPQLTNISKCRYNLDHGTHVRRGQRCNLVLVLPKRMSFAA